MAHRMTVCDPSDPDRERELEVEYDAFRGRDDESVGYQAPLIIRLHGPHDADIVEQIYARHIP